MTTDADNTTISIVIPVYNEADILRDCLPALDQALAAEDIRHEYIFVDDGSTDNSWDILLDISRNRPDLTLISLSRRFGKDIAVFAGIGRAAGKAVVVIDADLQDPPAIIPGLLQKWRQGHDIVIGIRRRRRGENWIRRLAAKIFYKLIQTISDCDLPPDSGDLCLLDRRAVDVILQFTERTRYFKGLINWIGFRRGFVEYTREKRKGGKSKWSYMQLTAFAIDAITSYSRLPLRIWTLAGISAAAIGFCYGVYVFVYTIVFGGRVPGYASMVMLILFLGGIQLISIGVISEYIGHLFLEVKNRPLFVIREIKAPDEKNKAE
ncbi:MAG: glycosyltransferase family 2 protein [Thermodesulfobacteriota bacterium]